MATRRTTMRSSTGTKLYAVRDESGKFKDIQTYKRAHAADLRHKSKAEVAAAAGPMEKKVKKAAKDVVKSVKGAVAAVERAAKRAVKQVAGRAPAAKRTVKKAAKKALPKPKTKKTAAKRAPKVAKKRTSRKT